MKSVTAALLLTLACLALSPNYFLVGDEPRSDAEEKLVTLQAERERLAAEVGANHPRLKQVDREIELTRKFLADSGGSEKLIPLQVERERMAAEFGANHPRVKQVDREIELTRKFLADSDPAETLAALQLEREQMAAKLGANHPRLKQADREIEFMRKLLSESAGTHDTSALNESGLLAVVRSLIERVDSLERELAELKARLPLRGQN